MDYHNNHFFFQLQSSLSILKKDQSIKREKILWSISNFLRNILFHSPAFFFLLCKPFKFCNFILVLKFIFLTFQALNLRKKREICLKTTRERQFVNNYFLETNSYFFMSTISILLFY